MNDSEKRLAALAILDKAENKRRHSRVNAAMNVLNGVAPTPRQPMIHHEFLLQCDCVEWFEREYPNIVIASSLNGVHLTKQQAKREKRAGMRAGIPDLQIFAARKGFNGLLIEMKNGKKGVLREEQLDMLVKLKAEGYCCAVCRSADHFKAIVKDYFGNERVLAM